MRYERFGWAAARLDDVANLVPARLTAILAVALAPAVGGSGRAALRTVRRDGTAHPSPNAGRCEAAFAGALGVSLGGTNVYQGRAERRGALGDGPPPEPADLDRAIRLSRLITVATAVLAALAACLLGARGRRLARPARPSASARRISPGARTTAGARILAGKPNAKGRAGSRLSWLAQPQHSFVMVGTTITSDDGSGGGVNRILGAATAAGTRILAGRARILAGRARILAGRARILAGRAWILAGRTGTLAGRAGAAA